MTVRAALLTFLLALGLQGCGNADDGTLQIAFVGSHEDVFSGGTRLSEPAQHLRAATQIGLVARDSQGEIIPALAERWIITDGGKSFIFRLRDGRWADGSDLTADSVQTALQAAIKKLDGTSMALDLAPLVEVRAMAGRVVELRLSSPFPALLPLLAQPELALDHGGGAGAMTIRSEGKLAVLEMRPPQFRGLPEDDNWTDKVRSLEIRAGSASEAIKMFDDGTVDAVLCGQIASLPLIDSGPLSSGTVRVEPATGLFGLLVATQRGPLATPELREALSMAIDRPALIAPFNIGGWAATTRLVAPGLPEDPGLITERWADQPLKDLRARAAGRIAGWRGSQSGAQASAPVVITVDLADNPGMNLLYRELVTQLATIGVKLERVPRGKQADLMLVDKVARFAAPRWFLNQFNCSLKHGLCDSEADALVDQALTEGDLATRANLLAQAEAKLTLANIYIPIGAPLRWSLIRGNVNGFAANSWAFHPLPPMAEIPK